MNENALIPLRRIVERVVRPVRASASRKQKMREELLAHVIAVFEGEVAHSDERTALACTEQRFGIPTELTRQFQDAVPPGDRIHRAVEVLGFRRDDSCVRRMLRYATWYSLILTFALPAWYVWVRLSDWLVKAADWPPEEARLLGSQVQLLDFFFFAVSFVAILYVLVSVSRKMTRLLDSQTEWERLPLNLDAKAFSN